MKYYDYNKAKTLIESTPNLAEASLGMREDWFWTAKTVWEDGIWTQTLFLGDLLEQQRLAMEELKARFESLDKDSPEHGKNRMAARFEVADKYAYEISSICGSNWATPVLQLTLSDGTELFHDCFCAGGTSEPRDSAFDIGRLGCMSGPSAISMSQIKKES